MKKKKLTKYLRAQGCAQRGGKKHERWENLQSEEVSYVPRHVEIKDSLANQICIELGIARIKK